MITIESNATIWTILVTTHSDANTKQPKVLLYYDFANGITNKEEEILLQGEPKLFTIKIITSLELGTPCVLRCSKKIRFRGGEILVDEVPTHLKVQDLKIARWTLQKDV